MSYYPNQYHQQSTQSTQSTSPRCGSDQANIKRIIDSEDSRKIDEMIDSQNKYSDCTTRVRNFKPTFFRRTPPSCHKEKERKRKVTQELFDKSKSKSMYYIIKAINNPSDENLDKFACYLSLLQYSYHNCGGSKSLETFINDFVKHTIVVNDQHDKLFYNTILKGKLTENLKNAIKNNKQKDNYESTIKKVIGDYKGTCA